MASTETNIQSGIQLALSPEFKLFRNNRGVATYRSKGKTTKVRYGVGPNGASDLIGFRVVTITADMVGQQIAQFAAVEVKKPGEKPKPEQAEFIDNIRQQGGFADWSDSVEKVEGWKS